MSHGGVDGQRQEQSIGGRPVNGASQRLPSTGTATRPGVRSIRHPIETVEKYRPHIAPCSASPTARGVELGSAQGRPGDRWQTGTAGRVTTDAAARQTAVSSKAGINRVPRNTNLDRDVVLPELFSVLSPQERVAPGHGAETAHRPRMIRNPHAVLEPIAGGGRPAGRPKALRRQPRHRAAPVHPQRIRFTTTLASVVIAFLAGATVVALQESAETATSSEAAGPTAPRLPALDAPAPADPSRSDFPNSVFVAREAAVEAAAVVLHAESPPWRHGQEIPLTGSGVESAGSPGGAVQQDQQQQPIIAPATDVTAAASPVVINQDQLSAKQAPAPPAQAPVTAVAQIPDAVPATATAPVPAPDPVPAQDPLPLPDPAPGPVVNPELPEDPGGAKSKGKSEEHRPDFANGPNRGTGEADEVTG